MQPNFLKFCYFLVVFMLFSCGNGNNSEEKKETVAAESTDIPVAETTSKKTILCFGDSITAGYGLDDVNDAFPGVLQSRIDSLGLDYVVVNSGLSGETSAGGRSRIKWVLNQKIDVFLLELGANDGLRGVALTETRANLQAIIDVVRDKNPNIPILLAGMELPPNMGQDYTSEFRSIFSDLAKKNNLAFVPFILKDVGGIPELNQSDGIHPTVEGHKIVANTVWEVLETVI
jgi:acyl-CoA thioesterase-1